LYPLDRLHLNSKGLGEDGGPTMGDEDLFFSVDGGVQVSTSGRKDGLILRDAVIQGNFQAARRAYGATFANLEAEIKGLASPFVELRPSPLADIPNGFLDSRSRLLGLQDFTFGRLCSHLT
jgi:hypothetical protein